MSEFPVDGSEHIREHVHRHDELPKEEQSGMLTTNQTQRQSSSTSTTSSSSISANSSSSTSTTSSSSSKVAKSSQKILKKISNFSQRLRSSMENLVDRYGNGSEEANLTKPPLILPLRRISVTSTDGSPPLNLLDNLYHGMSLSVIIPNMANLPAGQETMKYKQKNVTNASKTKVVTDGFSAEKATANSAEMRALQAGDVSYKEQSAATAARARVELDDVSAEKSVAAAREQRSLKAGDLSHQKSNNIAVPEMKFQGAFTSEKKAMTAQQQRQTVTIASKSGVSASKSMINAANAVNQLMNGMRPPTAEDELLSLPLDDLDLLCSKSNPQDVDCAIAKYCSLLDSFVERLKASADASKSSSTGSGSKTPQLLNRMNEIIRKAWAVPTHGHKLGYILCNTLRTRGGLDLLMSYCVANDHELQFSSAKLLEQCLTTENLAHVVENGLEKVVNVACMCTKNANSVDHARVGTGIYSIITKARAALRSRPDAVLFECRKNDVETLRHCAGALANQFTT